MTNLTIAATPTGWHISGIAPDTGSEFTADLPECRCDRKPCFGAECNAKGHCHKFTGYHREHVEKFLAAVARTYRGKTAVPFVPVREETAS